MPKGDSLPPILGTLVPRWMCKGEHPMAFEWLKVGITILLHNV